MTFFSTFHSLNWEVIFNRGGLFSNIRIQSNGGDLQSVRVLFTFLYEKQIYLKYTVPFFNFSKVTFCLNCMPKQQDNTSDEPTFHKEIILFLALPFRLICFTNNLLSYQLTASSNQNVCLSDVLLGYYSNRNWLIDLASKIVIFYCTLKVFLDS